MKTFFSALFLILALPWGSAAQNVVGRLAVDDCYNLWFLDDYEIRCDVIVFDPDVWSMSVGSGSDPALSPDGKRVVFSASRPDVFALTDLIVVNLEDGTRTTVTDRGRSPAWSADGQRIAFVTTTSTGTFELHVANADGTGLRQITSGTGFRGLPTWSPDGRLAFNCEVETGNFDICSINSDGTGFARLTTFAGSDGQPAFSPDGSRIAFVTNQFTEGTLAILNGDGTVSQLGAGVYGYSPAWSPDGSRIVFEDSYFGGACPADGRICYGRISAVYVDGTGLTRNRLRSQSQLGTLTTRLPAHTTVHCCMHGTRLRVRRVRVWRRWIDCELRLALWRRDDWRRAGTHSRVCGAWQLRGRADRRR